MNCALYIYKNSVIPFLFPNNMFLKVRVKKIYIYRENKGTLINVDTNHFMILI